MKMPRELTACTLWVAGLALLVFGTLDSARDGFASPFLAWGLGAWIAALWPTGSCILHRERERDAVDVEHIVEVVDALHEGSKDVSRLH